MSQSKFTVKHFLIQLVAIASLAGSAWAQDSVTVANDEDLQAFDQILSKQRQAAAAKPSPKTATRSSKDAAAFGEKISSRAKQLSNQVKREAFKEYVADALAEKRSGNSGTPGSNASDRGSNNRGMGNGAAANSNANRPKRGNVRP